MASVGILSSGLLFWKTLPKTWGWLRLIQIKKEKMFWKNANKKKCWSRSSKEKMYKCILFILFSFSSYRVWTTFCFEKWMDFSSSNFCTISTWHIVLITWHYADAAVPNSAQKLVKKMSKNKLLELLCKEEMADKKRRQLQQDFGGNFNWEDFSQPISC